MRCSRCNKQTEVVSEYYDFVAMSLIRDTYCTNCKSVLIEKFYEDNRYISEWIDLNVRNRKI